VRNFCTQKRGVSRKGEKKSKILRGGVWLPDLPFQGGGVGVDPRPRWQVRAKGEQVRILSKRGTIKDLGEVGGFDWPDPVRPLEKEYQPFGTRGVCEKNRTPKVHAKDQTAGEIKRAPFQRRLSGGSVLQSREGAIKKQKRGEV